MSGITQTTKGVLQGGSRSPVRSGMVLDELEGELERRGHRFARYADDCNIVVGSQRPGERVMVSVTRFIKHSTHGSRVEARKRAVDRWWNRKFLGFTLTRNSTKPKVAEKAIDRLKDRVRELRRTRGHRFADIVAARRETRFWRSVLRCGRSAEP